jgi:hypothetical protein
MCIDQTTQVIVARGNVLSLIEKYLELLEKPTQKDLETLQGCQVLHIDRKSVV